MAGQSGLLNGIGCYNPQSVSQSITIVSSGCISGGRIASDNKQDEVADEEAIEISDIIIYPNPTSNELTIQLIAPATQVTPIKLIDQLGKAVIRFSFNTGEQTKTVSTRDLVNGLYILHVEAGGRNNYKKVVVVHE